MLFLTGGTGMLGAHILFDLTRSGVKVRALRRKNSDLPMVKKIFAWYSDDAEQLFQQIEWVEGDLLDSTSLLEALDGVDCVIHAAAKVSFDPRDHADMLYENSIGTANLVDLVLELKIPRFCHVSSIAALGEQVAGIPVNEEFSWKNDRHRSAYSESKYLAEMEVWRSVQDGLSCVIVNPSVILGPGNWEVGSPRFFRTIDKGLRFFTTGSTGFVDVRDVSKAIIILVQSDRWEKLKNQRYILSAENRTYREVFDMIAVALNRPKPAIRATRFLVQAGWRVSRLVSFFTGKLPTLTKDTARTSMKVSLYDGSKITKTIDFVYTPITKTVRDIAGIYNQTLQQ